jgi:hypothetical protein
MSAEPRALRQPALLETLRHCHVSELCEIDVLQAIQSNGAAAVASIAQDSVEDAISLPHHWISSSLDPRHPEYRVQQFPPRSSAGRSVDGHV